MKRIFLGLIPLPRFLLVSIFKTSPKNGTAPAPRSSTTLQNLTKNWNRSRSQEQQYCLKPSQKRNRSTFQEQSYSSKPHQKLEPPHLPGAILLFKTPPKAGTAPPPRSTAVIQNHTNNSNRSNSQEENYCSKAH